MRIATWNLERPDPKDTVRNLARMEKIREIDADIWILTETHEVIDLSATHTERPRQPLCASHVQGKPVPPSGAAGRL